MPAARRATGRAGPGRRRVRAVGAAGASWHHGATASDRCAAPLPYGAPVTPDVLLVGAGDLGAAVGLRLADLGHDVLALRRNASQVPAPLVGRPVDLTREAPDLSD